MMDMIIGKCGKLHNIIDGCWYCDRIAEKKDSIDKLKVELKEYWLCSCGLRHPKDFVCERYKDNINDNN